MLSSGSSVEDLSADERGGFVWNAVAYYDTLEAVAGSETLLAQRTARVPEIPDTRMGYGGAGVRRRNNQLLSDEAAKSAVQRVLDTSRGTGVGKGSTAPRRRGAHQLSVASLTEGLAWELQRVFYSHFSLIVPPAPAGNLDGSAVANGLAFVFFECKDPIAVWPLLLGGSVLFFCSCGNILGRGRAAYSESEVMHPELGVITEIGSTCRHAQALRLAYGVVAAELGPPAVLVNLSLVLHRGMEIDDTTTPEPLTGMTIEDAGVRGRTKNTPLYAVYYADIEVWAPVIVKPHKNPHQLACCFLPSCLSQPHGCIHAKRVNTTRKIDAAESSAAAAEMMDTLQMGGSNSDGDSDYDMNGAVAGAPADGGGHDEGITPFPLPDATKAAVRSRARRSRNMFPCAHEVDYCVAYHETCDESRAQGHLCIFPELFIEEQCIECDEDRGGKPFAMRRAVLYSMRGEATIFVCTWTCTAGHVVEYDGSVDALFAASPQVVYTRMFLDAVVEFSVIGRSTMAAATEFLTSIMRNTGVYKGSEPGRARQLLSDAAGEFSDTLVIPAAAFLCTRCGEGEARAEAAANGAANGDGGVLREEQGDVADQPRLDPIEERNKSKAAAFEVVLVDGQMLSVPQDKIAPMLRPTVDVPRADMTIAFSCTISSAAARRVVRNRVRARVVDSTDLSAAEATAWSFFVSASAQAAPPLPPPPLLRLSPASEPAASLPPSPPRGSRTASSSPRPRASTVSSAHAASTPPPPRSSSGSPSPAPSSSSSSSSTTLPPASPPLAASAGRRTPAQMVQAKTWASSFVYHCFYTVVSADSVRDAPPGAAAGAEEETRAAAAVGSEVPTTDESSSDEHSLFGWQSDTSGGATLTGTDENDAPPGQVPLNQGNERDGRDAPSGTVHAVVDLPAADRAVADAVLAARLLCGAGPRRTPRGRVTSATALTRSGAKAISAQTRSGAPASSASPRNGSKNTGALTRGFAATAPVSPREGATQTRASSRRTPPSGTGAARRVDGVPCTDDDWMVPLPMVAATDSVESTDAEPRRAVVDPDDPVSPLTSAAMMATAAALERAREVPPPVDPITVQANNEPLSYSDLLRYLPLQKLSGEMINSYIYLLEVRHRLQATRSPSAPTHVFFKSYFYDVMLRNGVYNHANVARWSRHLPTMVADDIYIPCHVGGDHWVLAVIKPAASKVLLYDSLGGENSSVTANLCRWAKDEAAARGEPERRWMACPMRRSSPQQSNSKDCGLFVLKTIDTLARGHPITDVAINMNYYRRRMAAEVLFNAV